MGIEVLFICGGIYLLTLAGEKIYYSYEMFRGIHPKKVKYSDIPQEQYNDEQIMSSIYDIEAFKSRMKEMKSDTEIFDGIPLYDSPPPAIKDDEPGVEIITPSLEKAIDERAGR